MSHPLIDQDSISSLGLASAVLYIVDFVVHYPAHFIQRVVVRRVRIIWLHHEGEKPPTHRMVGKPGFRHTRKKKEDK